MRSRTARPITLAALCALLTAMAGGMPALAQSGDLDETRALKSEAEARAEKLASEAAALREQTRTVSRDMAAVAERVRAGETELDRLDAEEAGLVADVGILQDSLTDRRAEIARSLSALAGVARVPPLAAIARPGEIRNARLAASALAGLRPGLEARMTALRAQLDELERKRRELAELRDKAAQALAAMQQDRETLNGLLARKRALAEKTEDAARAANARVKELAKKVDTLTALLRELERLEPVAAPAVAAPPTEFGSLKGRLPLPVSGNMKKAFGESADAGNANGMIFSTRPGALVTAPHDAIVRFAGVFRSYGRLLILDFGDGYHLLVAGLSGIDVVAGQWLLAGEPVGRMPEAAADGRPEIYLELRRAGLPIDPGPWLAPRQGKTSG
ncbi:MAG: murein hydrolase activator EnvC family protein [Minwuia sp.]|uniref:murein hydrolase activator EnvC family protein n=1 Tax=Minwuia sp. TaxID=2493630 RepID=UPI003A8B91CF